LIFPSKDNEEPTIQDMRVGVESGRREKQQHSGQDEWQRRKIERERRREKDLTERLLTNSFHLETCRSTVGAALLPIRRWDEDIRNGARRAEQSHDHHPVHASRLFPPSLGQDHQQRAHINLVLAESNISSNRQAIGTRGGSSNRDIVLRHLYCQTEVET
jgi:hypothetical protein